MADNKTLAVCVLSIALHHAFNHSLARTTFLSVHSPRHALICAIHSFGGLTCGRSARPSDACRCGSRSADCTSRARTARTRCSAGPRSRARCLSIRQSRRSTACGCTAARLLRVGGRGHQQEINIRWLLRIVCMQRRRTLTQKKRTLALSRTRIY